MDLSGHTSLAPLAEAIADVQAVASVAGLEIYLAGALARDLWLAFAHGIDTGRKTSDIDFAIQCRDWAAFERLRTALVESGEFTPSRRGVHNFRHRNGSELDIVPYGGVEGPDRKIAWPPEGASVMNALGFSEAAATAVPIDLPGGVTVPVVSLPALALLKLVAWDDRWRWSAGKDAKDLFVIAKSYLDAGNQERLFESGADIMARSDFDYEAAGAELLGRDCAALCHGALRTFISALLTRETDPGGQRMLAYQMSADEEEGLRLLIALRRGFEFHGRIS